MIEGIRASVLRSALEAAICYKEARRIL